MIDQPVIRLFRCRPVRTAFDSILRDVMIPDLRRRPGLIDVHVGRNGPDELGERVVASAWVTRSAMADSLGETLDASPFHPEYLAETTDRSIEILDAAAILRFSGVKEPAVLRLARGRVRDGELGAYVEEARLGALADDDDGVGPIAMYLATGSRDRFVTLSVWDSWPSIAAATGADTRRPVATRHGGRLESFEVTHYEIVGVPAVDRSDAAALPLVGTSTRHVVATPSPGSAGASFPAQPARSVDPVLMQGVTDGQEQTP